MQITLPNISTLPQKWQTLWQQHHVHWLAEDDDLLLLDKPTGMPTEPTQQGGANTLLHLAGSCLADLYRAQSSVPTLRGQTHTDTALQKTTLFTKKNTPPISSSRKPIPKKIEQLAAAHRLDVETSGAVILTKNNLAAERMRQLFANRRISRRYLALVEGKIDPSLCQGPFRRITVEKTLVKNNKLGIWKSVDKHTKIEEQQQAVDAVSRFFCLWQGEKHALLWCAPVTGRTHQLRAHLAGLGHPLVGDWRYGAAKIRMPVFGLHACRLRFVHPFTQKNIFVSSAPSATWIRMAQSVGLDTTYWLALSRRLCLSEVYDTPPH